jgi:antitoxin VapB
MALTIENPEAERLAAEVAEMAGESQEAEDRVARWRRFLEEEVWPNISPEARGKRITKEEREEILGYGPDGV